MKLPKNLVLFNGDCTFLFAESCQGAERFTRDNLHRFIDLLAQSGVDTYLQNPNAQKPWYPSRVLSPVWDGYQRDDQEFFRGHFPVANATTFPPEKLNYCLERSTAVFNCYLDLLEAGVDWMQEIASACQRNKITPWLSIRMNDAHGAVNWEKSYFNCELQQNPHYRLSGYAPGMIYPLLNYRHSEVRDYYFTMIRELVEEYDYEGLELDWLRNPYCCEPPIDQSALDLMTEWIAQIRQLTRRKAEQTGRPYPLGLRLPIRLDALNTIGLDISRFAREGLIDFIAPSNYLQTSWDVPYDKLRAIVGDNVALYGVLENAPNWLTCRYSSEITEATAGLKGFAPSHRCLSASEEFIRGNAAGKLAQGADGIYAYNFFCTDEPTHNPHPNTRQAKYSALQGLNKLETLRGKPKHYTLSTANYVPMHRFFEFADQLPITLESGDQRAFVTSMCAEPDTEATKMPLELVVQIVMKGCPGVPHIILIFNGCLPNGAAEPTENLLFPTGVFTHHIPENIAYNYYFNASCIKEGWNELFLQNGNSDAQRIVSIEFAVRRLKCAVEAHDSACKT